MKIFLFSTHSATASHRTDQDNEPPHDDRNGNPCAAASGPTQPEPQEETPCGDCTLYLVTWCNTNINYKRYG